MADYSLVQEQFKVPERYFIEETERPGRLEEVWYDSHAYGEDCRKVRKRAIVYLPDGYDETKAYDVLYLQHGGGGNEASWMVHQPACKNMVDHLIAEGASRPVIIVMPCFYPGDKSPVRPHPDEAEGKARWDTEYLLPQYFHIELRNDLIPVVEKKYHTFAQMDPTPENLIASRSHRAFAGLSMGSMTTYWCGLYHCLDIISCFGPMSGCVGPGRDNKAAARLLLNALNWNYKDYPVDHMICCNGTDDIAHDEHVEIMKMVLEGTNKLKDGINYRFIDIPGEEHRFSQWFFDLYTMLQVFWH